MDFSNKLIDVNSVENLNFSEFIELINSLQPNNFMPLEALSVNSIQIEIKNLEQSKIIAKYISDLAAVDPNILNNSATIIEIAINELLINAIEHGLLNISYELKTTLLQQNNWEEYIKHAITKLPANKVVKMFISIDLQQHKLLIKVVDPGHGFDIKKLDFKIDHSLKHGRGHILINTLEDLVYHEVGNIVTFSVKYNPTILNK